MQILEVAIGLTFVYVLFSLICTTLTEGIARVVSLRSRTLQEAIRHMIEGEKKGVAGLTVEELYKSPFLQNLARKGKIIKTPRPSYIPSQAFSQALFDKLLDSSKTTASTSTSAAFNAAVQKGVEAERKGLIEAIEKSMAMSQQTKNELVNLTSNVNYTALTLRSKAVKTFADLRTAVETIPPESPLGKGLTRILDTAEQEAADYDEALAKARLATELWFDQTMERVTGWYARNARTIVVSLAVIVTIAFNIDTFAITRALWSEDTIRQAMVSQAEAFVNNNNVPSEDPQSEAVTSSVATEDQEVTESGAGAETQEDGSDAGSVQATETTTPTLTTLLSEVDTLGVPIGWVFIVEETEEPKQLTDSQLFIQGITRPAVVYFDRDEAQHQAEIVKAERYGQQWPRNLPDGIKKLAGLFITIVALSLGAPFWFDLLNKFVNMRAAGKEPNPADAVDKSISITTNSIG